MFRKTEYHTIVPLNECLARLRRTSAEHPWSITRLWQPLPEGTIQTSVWGRRFLISAWPRMYTRNSFTPMFLGSLRESARGVLISGRFVFHPVILVFSVVWFGGALAGVIVALVLLIGGLREPGGPAPGSFTPLAAAGTVFAAGCAIVALCIRSGRGQREAVERYLTTELEAQRRDRDAAG